MAWVEVGPADGFREGRGRRVRVDGVDVAVFRIGSDLFAIADACPHMGASLADGVVVRGRVVCHWHGWTFDLRTGEGDQRPWACAAVYGTRVDGGRLWLEAPAREPAADDPAEEWIRDPERYFKQPPASDAAPDGEEGASETDGDPGGEQERRKAGGERADE